MGKPHSCPNCHSHDVEFAGLQWFPARVFRAMRRQPSVVDEEKQRGALHSYTCKDCHTTFTEALTPNGPSS
jgi:hypothetical protein